MRKPGVLAAVLVAVPTAGLTAVLVAVELASLFGTFIHSCYSKTQRPALGQIGSARWVNIGSAPTHEFIRRFLLHVVPTGFMRIRHDGFLANRHREAKLACRHRLLGAPAPIASAPVTPAEGDRESRQDYRDRYEQLTGISLRMCPHCKKGHMVCINIFLPGALHRAPPKLEVRDAGTY